MYQMTDLQSAGVNAGKWMRAWGYPGATVTPARTPGGVYVTAEQALALVAFDGHQVGKPALQSLVRASNRSPEISLMTFASNGYSAHAMSYALKMDIALFAFSPFGGVAAANDRARAFLGGARQAHWPAADGST